MARCRVCGSRSPLTASSLGVCATCLRAAQPDLWLHLARFLAGLDPDIPHSLLAFHPQFYLQDLPITSRQHAGEALAAARAAGMARVRIGNVHLLGEPYGRVGHPAV
jgi:hypothetical protein